MHFSHPFVVSFIFMYVGLLPIISAVKPNPLKDAASSFGNIDLRQVQREGMARPDMVQHGYMQPLCTMFGCDCVPPRGARCCSGYRFDGKKCRKLAKKG